MLLESVKFGDICAGPTPAPATQLMPFRYGIWYVAFSRMTDSATDPAANKRPKRALVVDDQAPVRMFHRRLLEQMGCECVEAADGPSALKAAEEPFDLVLLDVRMPGMDGFEVCKRMRERAPQSHVKIIVVSGNGDTDELAQALPRGADDYIAKPFSPQELASRVQALLAA